MSVIDLLNEARSRELTAIAQYMEHHYELEDAGYGKLAAKLKEIAIVEMRHAESLAERILFLGGVPTTKLDTGIQKQQEIPGMLATDIGLEDGAVKLYNKSAELCAQEGDQVSRNLFTTLATQEEGHLDAFQVTADHVAKLGAVYLASLTD